MSLLFLSYATGILCIGFGLFPELLQATSFNLLLTFVLILYSCYQRDRRTLIAVCSIYGIGLVIELLGVHTGLLFGEYRYGDVLGPKIMDTPILIGVNWFILLSGCFATVEYLVSQWNSWKKALVMALLMTTIDLILEPVAIHYGFWQWTSEQVPIQNYIAWFCISFLLSFGMQRYLNIRNHLLAIFSLICITVFFIVLNLQIPNVSGLSLSMLVG